MNFLALILRNFLYFLKRKLFLYFGKQFLIFQETETLSNSLSSKNKKNPPRENFLYFEKWNFLALILRNFLYFLKKKLFLYSEKRKPRRKLLILQETELSYISENGTFKLEKWKNPLLNGSLYFRKWNFVAPSFKHLLYFRIEFSKPKKDLVKVVFYDAFLIFTTVKHR